MNYVFILIFSLWMLSIGAWAQKRLPIANDLYRIQEVQEPDSSPDGQWVVYTVTKTNRAKNKIISDIWRASFDGKNLQQLTFTKEDANSMPKWSPDGKWIAYLSDKPGTDTVQIWIVRPMGGKPLQLTNMQGSVSDFAWSPDSKKIALIANDPTSKDAESQPIVVDRYQFKNDDSGFLGHDREHLYVFTIQDKSVNQLTSGAHDEWAPAWAPDGRHIAFVAKRGKDSDRQLSSEIYLIEPKIGSKEQQLTHYKGIIMDPEWDSSLAFSPDGTRIAYLRGRNEHWLDYAPSQIAVINTVTKQDNLVSMADKWHYKPKWSEDGSKLYALVEENTNTYLNEINVDSGKAKQLTHGLRTDKDFTRSRGRLVLLSTDDTHPAELYALDSQIRPISDHNKLLVEEVRFQPAENIEFSSFDGVTIGALLMKPYGYQSQQKYPGIFYLHGGPVGQTSHEFDFDWQYYAANGYIVIGPNPRGSSGRGFDFARAIYADWGALDVKDVLAAADYVLGLGLVDPKRLAVGGWSYGAMLTNYVTTSDNRFKAALSGAGTANILLNYGVDEYTLEYELELGTPWANPELYLKLSYPFMHAQRIKTPTLFFCGQLDYNVPCEGSEQLYQALRSQNIPTQLVLYPNQKHSFDNPSFSLDVLRRSVNWLNVYLK